MSAWGETQLRVARAFQEDVAPLYRSAYPDRPSYHDPHRRQTRAATSFYGSWKGRRLDYEEYARLVAEGTFVPRRLHGCMHACRVMVFTALISVLHRRLGKTVGDLERLQMAAAFHDAGREDEGRDFWDSDSARLLADWLTAHGADAATAARWERIVRLKEASPPESLEQAILHDADALDIQRVAHVRGRFDATRLWFWHLPCAALTLEDKLALIAESGRFIAITESDRLMSDLEGCEDYYVTVLHILAATQRTSGALPLLNELLDELIG